MHDSLLKSVGHFLRCYGQNQHGMDSRFAVNLVRSLHEENEKLRQQLNQKVTA